MSEQSVENDARMDRVERTREALNATRWWQFSKRESAARAYKAALLEAAFAEIDARVTPPAKDRP